ncbi:MAG TPA: hypothetical protein VMW10_13200 [Alphaproteobacteria bacterium]|nr:hypothetical protein [Alphaproteobacteria bacterium]
MTEQKIAHLEHISQLLIFQIKNVHKLIGKAWYELELARSDLRELMEVHEEWEKEKGLNQELYE